MSYYGIIFSSVMLFIGTLNLHAQKVSSSIIIDSINLEKVSRHQLLFSNDSVSLTLEIRNKIGYIVKFQNCCGEIKRVQIDPKLDTPKGWAKFESVQQIGQSLILFFQGTDEDGYQYLYAQQLGVVDFVLNSEPILLVDHAYPAGEFPGLQVSADKSKLLVYSQIYGQDACILSITVFDQELNRIWEKLNYAHQKGSSGATCFAVSNSGDVAYVNRQEVPGHLVYMDEKSVKAYSINCFTEDGETYSPYFFTAIDFVIKDSEIIFDSNGKPVVVGYYETRFAQKIGTYTARPTESNHTDFNRQQFTPTFATASMTEADSAKYFDGKNQFVSYLWNLKLIEVLIDKLGNIYVVGEITEQFVSRKLKYKIDYGNHEVSDYAKINGEIFVSKIDPQGDLLWHTRITRAILLPTNIHGVSGIHAIVNGDGLTILVNDHPSNNIQANSEMPVVSATDSNGESVPCILSVDKKGKVTRSLLSLDSISGSTFDLSNSCLAGPAGLRLFVRNGKSCKLISVTPS